MSENQAMPEDIIMSSILCSNARALDCMSIYLTGIQKAQPDWNPCWIRCLFLQFWRYLQMYLLTMFEPSPTRKQADVSWDFSVQTSDLYHMYSLGNDLCMHSSYTKNCNLCSRLVANDLWILTNINVISTTRWHSKKSNCCIILLQ